MSSKLSLDVFCNSSDTLVKMRINSGFHLHHIFVQNRDIRFYG